MDKKNLEKNGYYDNIEKYFGNMDFKKMNECPCNAGYVDIDKKKLDWGKILNNKKNSLFSLEVFDEYLKKISSTNKKSKKNNYKSKKNITKKRNSDLNITDCNNINNCSNNKIENTKLKKKNIVIMLLIFLFYLKFVKKN